MITGLLIRGCCVLLVIGIVSLMPALLLYYLGYAPIYSWNHDAVATTCQIVGYSVVQHQCSYACDCTQTCAFKFGCSRSCSTCYSTCYDGVIHVTYPTGNITETSSITVYGNQGNPNATQSDLSSNYLMDSLVRCYYESANPTDVRLGFNSDDTYLIFFIIFIVLGGLGVLIWISYEICRYRQTQREEKLASSVELNEAPSKPEIQQP